MPRKSRPKLPPKVPPAPAFGAEFSIELGCASDPEGLVEADGFAEALQAHVRAFRRTAEFVSSNSEARFRYLLTNVTRNSPPVAYLRPAVVGDSADIFPYAEAQLLGFMEDAQENRPLPELPYPVLTSYRQLLAVNSRWGIRSRVSGGAVIHPVEIKPRALERLKIMLADDVVVSGSVEGYLKYINFHDNTNTMRVYAEPELGIPFVTCKFSQSLAGKAEQAVNKYVVIPGELRYRRNADHPYHVRASDVEVVGRAPNLPPFEETWGIARAHLPGRTTEDLIREIRRGW